MFVLLYIAFGVISWAWMESESISAARELHVWENLDEPRLGNASASTWVVVGQVLFLAVMHAGVYVLNYIIVKNPGILSASVTEDMFYWYAIVYGGLAVILGAVYFLVGAAAFQKDLIELPRAHSEGPNRVGAATASPMRWTQSSVKQETASLLRSAATAASWKAK